MGKYRCMLEVDPFQSRLLMMLAEILALSENVQTKGVDIGDCCERV